MTVGITELLDLAISPQIGPVNFFHLRNLLHTIVEHFGIGEVEAQQAEVRGPMSLRSSSEASSSVESSSESDEDEESEESADDGHVSEEEVIQTVIDEDGQEKTVTVMVKKPPKPKKKQSEVGEKDGNEKEGQEKKKRRESKHSKDKDSSREKERKHSKHEKEGDEKDDKKKKRDRKSSYGGDSVYGKKDDTKKERRMTMDSLSETPELININRRLEAAEMGIKSLRNIIDSMVNQVDFGDEVGGILKAQLDQVQQQLNKVELLPEGEAPKKEKKRKGSKAKGPQDVPKDGIITEGSQPAPGVGEDHAQPTNVIPVIPPPGQISQDMPKLQPGRLPSRKDEKRKISLPMKGGKRPPSQEDKTPLQRRTTIEDLKLRRKAREEGVTIEEIEAREAAQETKKEEKSKAKEKEKGKEDEKEKADKKKGEDSSDDELLDSEEEREAMEEMIMEEIEAALENTDDPEAQAYALRLSIEQMNNMKKSFMQSQEEFKKDMEKNKRAIELISKDLAAFRASRKAQDAEGFNAVHHVHSMVLELQAKHEKLVQTTAELVNEYNRREKSLEELFDSVDRLDQKKADKQHVSQEIGIKADKGDLESKVSVNQFDESFNLLDRGLSDALEKMESQMSIEDALRETLQELQSKMHLKLDRQELDSLRDQLESRIRQVQVVRATVKEKPEDCEPAGFRRTKPEKVHCISCDRPLELNPGEIGPNMPKMQSLPGQKSSKPYTTFELEHIRLHQKMNIAKKPPVIGADLGYQAQKLKNEVVAMTGLVDLIELPPSQRYCGGSHTIMHPYRRSFKTTGSHLSQYVVIREDSDAAVALPRKDFIVPRDNSLKRCMKTKLPAIGQNNTREPSPPPEYIAEFSERPLSAPATPSVGHRRKLSSPQALKETSNSPPQNEAESPAGSPVQMEKISVTIPSPTDEEE
ncbi:glutamic acid-rich protein-like [Stylophora pistillata]|uniref:glutamic acid-rich protein-like n=1 Tax=Stylophora pistillata TaxID=50429 RepID=UPI000C03D8F5|nr:glutamic acid-rich protein-like [Stylophora pistillata]